MKREIKFRAFLHESKTMHYDIGAINFFTDGTYSVELVDGEVPSHFQDKEILSLMQYTGLHDKNGKEIYEGDIVRSRNNPVNDGFVKYVTVNESEFPINGFVNDNFGDWLSIWPKDTEVIGNIYENPELL